MITALLRRRHTLAIPLDNRFNLAFEFTYKVTGNDVGGRNHSRGLSPQATPHFNRTAGVILGFVTPAKLILIYKG